MAAMNDDYFRLIASIRAFIVNPVDSPLFNLSLFSIMRGMLHIDVAVRALSVFVSGIWALRDTLCEECVGETRRVVLFKQRILLEYLSPVFQ